MGPPKKGIWETRSESRKEEGENGVRDALHLPPVGNLFRENVDGIPSQARDDHSTQVRDVVTFSESGHTTANAIASFQHHNVHAKRLQLTSGDQALDEGRAGCDCLHKSKDAEIS